ncbi:MAG: PAS domain-containing protein, partial [Gemmatimonadales bacterium]
MVAVILALILWSRRRDRPMGWLVLLLGGVALAELPAIGHRHLYDEIAAVEIVEALVSALMVLAVIYLERLLDAHDGTTSALSLEKASLEQLFENAPDALVLVDNDSRILRINSNFTRLFGYQLDEVRGRSVDELLAPPDLVEEAEAITLEAAHGTSINRETLRRRRDGSLVDVSILATPIVVKGEQVAVYGSYRDVTDRKRVEQALRESEQRYAIATEGTNDGLWDWDLDTDRLYLSPRWRAMLGWKAFDLGDRPVDWFALIHPDDRERVETGIREHRDRGRDHFDFEYRIQGADGSYHWVL